MSDIEGDDICLDGETSLESCLNVIPRNPAFQKPATDYDNQSPGSTMITTAELVHLRRELELKERKLTALKNIHLLVKEKDDEILSLKEKNRSYADALMMSDARYSQLLKMMAKLTSDIGDREKKDLFPDVDARADKITEDDASTSGEIAGVISFVSSDIEYQTGKKKVLVDDPAQYLSHGMPEKDQTETDLAAFQQHASRSFCGDTKQESDKKLPEPLVSRGTCDDSSVNSLGVDLEHIMSVRSREKSVASLAKGLGLSKDLLSKVMQQNARLKQVLRHVLRSHGLTVEDYLDRQEYVSIIEQLRQDIRNHQLRDKEREQLLASVQNLNRDDLAQHNLKLEETIHKQNRMLAVKQAMIEAYAQKCDELEDKIKLFRMKFQGLTEVQDNQTLHRQELPGSDGMIERSSEMDKLHHNRSPTVSSSELGLDGSTADGKGHATKINDKESLNLSAKSAIDTEARSDMSLVCERCEKSFDEKDFEKYREHCNRCKDD